MAGYDRLTPDGRKFLSQMEELKKLELHVGFQHGDSTDEESGADIADVAMWNELGTAHSPARPFIRQSVDGNAGRINAMCQSQLRAITRGDRTAETALRQIGAMQKALVQSEILDGDFEPNAPSTIKRKGSDRPLVDTGRMMQTVSFAVQQKGG